MRNKNKFIDLKNELTININNAKLIININIII